MRNSFLLREYAAGIACDMMQPKKLVLIVATIDPSSTL